MDGPHDVDLGVERRVVDARPDAGACGQVDDRVRVDLLDDPIDRLAVADVELDQAATGAPAGRGQVRALARLGIEGVEVVDDDDLGSVGQEPIDEVRADEAGAAGHERAHPSFLQPSPP